MIKGKTKSGFEYTIDERVKNDWDFMEAFSDIQEEGATFSRIRTVLTMMLTAEGFAALKDHVRANNDGIADITAITAEFTEICQDDRLKNS